MEQFRQLVATPPMRQGSSRSTVVARSLWRFAPILVAATAFQTPASADSNPTWNASGFGTLGVTSQSGGNGWGLHRNSTQIGASSDVDATQDSRLGLQLNWSAGSLWEAAVQAVALRRAADTPLLESLEWAYVGYRPLPNTRIRLGRTSPDIFLFADSRNVGFALPWARPPVDFYGFAPVASIDGADLEQRWSAGDATWRARGSWGSFNTSLQDFQGARLPLQGRDTWALGVTREEGSLLLKASYLRARLRLDVGPDATQLLQALQQLAGLPVPGLGSAIDPLVEGLWTGGHGSYTALAAQYEAGPWTLIAEGSSLKVPHSPLNAWRGYASLGYRHASVTYFGVISRVTPKDGVTGTPDLLTALTPVIGAPGAQQAQVLAGYAATVAANSRYDQSTYGIGMRWDFTPNTALKLQVDRFNVHPNGGAGWRFADVRPARGTLLSVLVDFVWGQ